MASVETSKVGYTVEFKQEVIKQWESKKFAQQKDLQAYVKSKLGKTLGRSVISDWITKDRDRIMSAKGVGKKKMTESKLPLVEQEIYEYVIQCNEFNGTVTGDNIRKAAREVTEMMITHEKLPLDFDFQFSNGWLEGFKKRWNLKSWRRFGEKGSADEDGIVLARRNFRIVLERLMICKAIDVYNLDETGLRWLAPPNRTISDSRPNGFKRAEDRYTVMVCCNAAGTRKQTLMIVAKPKNSKSFKHYDPRPHVWYRCNASAWMTGALFRPWLEAFNVQMRDQGRSVCLCMDNCSAHSSAFRTEPVEMAGLSVYKKMSNVTVVLFRQFRV